MINKNKKMSFLVLGTIVFGLVFFAYFLYLSSPYPVIMKLNESLRKGDIRIFREYSDSQRIAQSIVYDVSDLLLMSPYPKMNFNTNNEITKENLNMFIEKCISETVESGDCIVNKISSSSLSLKQLLYESDIYFKNYIPLHINKFYRNEAVVKFPFYSIKDGDVVINVDLFFKKNQGKWELYKVKNCGVLITYLNENRCKLSERNIQIFLKDILNDVSLYKFYREDLLDKYDTFSSYSYRYTKFKTFQDKTLSTEYSLFERNKEGDIHYKYVHDDEFNFTDVQRDIYFLSGIIYYHGSPGTGWVKINENSATISMIKTPPEILTSIIEMETPNSIVKIDPEKAYSFTEYLDYIDVFEENTAIHLRWTNELDTEALLFISDDEILIGGVVLNVQSDESKIFHVFQNTSTNKPIIFSIDTRVER